ncbi:MAG: molybdate ABC transporter substrate-binding protein [Betaproteobacteria bacterium]|nr:molybdate ABC transporter substrate-binding protein [Betaproteobacteria bacterium]
MYRLLMQVTIALLALQFGVSAMAADLIVSAAASLTNAFTDIGHEFERAHPDTKVVFNFAGSGQLLQQIAKGAPVDVFASADQETMDKAEVEGLVEAGTRADFVRNSLVVVVPVDSTLSVASLNDLTKSEIRHVAIGNPDSVPVGRYSKAVLTASGHWDALEPKVVNTQNVRQSLDYVSRGEVEAAFVYRTDAAILPNKVRIVLEVPTQKPILYPIAAIRASGDKIVVKYFIAFVQSNAGTKIFQKYGFGKP